ncbi:MAG TPA: hypothetical protein VL225_20295 [Vicinamibacterales bacterium]|jgi:hypothetical protein|nr:hypothetical protein [Vicinamibacterales bacterium]
MLYDRRDFLRLGGLAALAARIPSVGRDDAVDYTIRIGNALVELAPDRIISTTATTASSPDRCCD